MPRGGGLSANDDVTLVVSKARYGLLPNFVGSSLADVARELKRLKLRSRVVSADGDAGDVLAAEPAAGRHRRARARRQARGRGRLTNAEPASA